MRGAVRYLSVCSGIEAASVAWHPLGWQPVAFAEIEAFPSAVLAHHYPDVPNLGDMTKFKDWPDATIDLLVGGTPCQSFSVAGLRKGMADPRGNLALTYLAIADRYRPEWVVWENVPGVLSSSGGRDFGAFVGGLGELGYGWAYRTIDAQYVRTLGFGRAVPQRRRRVFVVGNLGSWRRAAAVLFEPESLSGNPAPRRQAGEEPSGSIGAGSKRSGGRIGADEAAANQLVAFGGNNTSGPVDVSTALQAHAGPKGRMDFASETFLAVAPTLDANYGRLQGHDNQHIDSGAGLFVAGPVAKTLTRGAESAGKAGYAGRRQEDDENLVAQPYSITPSNSNKDYNAREADKAQALTGGGNRPSARGGDLVTTLAVRGRGDGHQLEYRSDGTANAVLTPNGGRAGIGVGAIAQGWAVRRLTPTECERLQGFPDGYTAITYRRKPAADGPRYKALGNSMAVNCMRWIGRRIELVRELLAQQEAA